MSTATEIKEPEVQKSVPERDSLQAILLAHALPQQQLPTFLMAPPPPPQAASEAASRVVKRTRNAGIRRK